MREVRQQPRDERVGIVGAIGIAMGAAPTLRAAGAERRIDVDRVELAIGERLEDGDGIRTDHAIRRTRATEIDHARVQVLHARYPITVRFCPWYPLAAAAAHAPAREGVLQLRVAAGLVDYPRGKSAMVHYAHARDVRAEAIALAASCADRELLCRHLEPDDGDRDGADFAAVFARLHAEFARRFGAPPRGAR